MKNLITKRPALFAFLLMLALEAIVLGALLLSNLAGIPILSLDLPILLLNAIVAAILIGVMRWWKETGFNAPSQWKNLGLIIVPLVVLIAPTLFLQPQFPPLNRAIILVIVTLLIGFQEEAIFRGILISVFRPQGAMKAVLISAALFGVIHINSLFVGRDPLFVLAQIVASFFGAIGLGALRIRTNTLVPLILLHAFNDFLQFSATGGMEAGDVDLTIPMLKVGISALMALYGFYLLRGYKDESRAAE